MATMIEKWAKRLPERRVIEEFFEWLERHHPGKSTCDINIDKVLDEYHEIDRKQLDDDRRNVLNQVQCEHNFKLVHVVPGYYYYHCEKCGKETGRTPPVTQCPP